LLPRWWQESLAALSFNHARYHALRRSSRIGARVEYRDLSASTMDDARSGAAALGAGSCGSAYIAGGQTAARGRQGRAWSAGQGLGLYVTYHLCAPNGPNLAERLPLHAVAGGLATADAVFEVTSLRPDLKWPNDVLYGGRKLAGILAETVHGTRHEHQGRRSEVDIFLGIGINLRPHPGWSPDIAALATSIEQAEVDVPSLESLLASLSAALEWWLERLDDDPASVVEAWKPRLTTLGRTVRLALPGGDTAEGDAIDVSAAGDLVLRHRDGTTTTYAAGDVHSV